jgi:hypothetical protein
MHTQGAAPGTGIPGERLIERERDASLPRTDRAPRSKLPAHDTRRRFVA